MLLGIFIMSIIQAVCFVVLVVRIMHLEDILIGDAIAHYIQQYESQQEVIHNVVRGDQQSN